MRISDWSSDVCSSDLRHHHGDQSLRHFRCPLVAFETGCTMREARLQGKILSFRHDRTPSALVAAPSSAHSSAMPMTRIAALLLALFLLAAAPIRAEEAGERRPVTILISIDGFRADYLNRGLTPNISRLAAEGAHGKLRPSFQIGRAHV